MIKSIYFLPHGMQIIPGTEDEQMSGFAVLNQQMEKVVSKMKNDKIETIFLVTPHGYSLQQDFVFYLHNEFKGITYKLKHDSVVYGTPIDTFTVKGDLEFTQEFAKILRENKGLNIQELIHGVSEYPLALNWGTSVPLYYISKFTDIPVSIISIPRMRHDDIVKTLERVHALSEELLALPRNAALVISGDLSHTHDVDSKYGYHESSKEFDELVVNWFNSMNRDHLNAIMDLQANALACGMVGLAFIQQIFDKSTAKYYCSDYFYEVPTYFGMGIARWTL